MHIKASILPMGRRQAEPLQPSEINGEEKNHLQPMKDPTLEWRAASEEGYDSEGVYAGEVCHWEDCSLHKGPILVELHGGLSPVAVTLCCSRGGL